MKDNEKVKKSAREINVSIVPLLKELLKKSWIIAIVGVMMAALFFGATKLMIKPTYRCRFTAYVNNQQLQTNREYLTNSDLTASKELVKTFAEILKSETILTKAAENLGLDYSYEKLLGMVTTEIRNETEIITVYVVHKNPQRAYDLATEIARISPGYMAEIVEGSSMKIIDYPKYTDQKYKPSYARYTILGFFVGVLIVIIILIIRYYADDTFTDENEAEALFDLPILGVIPDSNISKASSYGYKANDAYSYQRHPDERGS